MTKARRAARECGFGWQADSVELEASVDGGVVAEVGGEVGEVGVRQR